MGSSDYDNEKPPHKVTITKPFYIGKYQVTQEQWQKIMGNNPSYFKGAKHPVDQVSWDDVQEFIRRLNEMEKNMLQGTTLQQQGLGTTLQQQGQQQKQQGWYRLPTEAEWEYCCRAGSTMKYCFGDDESLLKQYAWYNKNSNRTTHPVGLLKPNVWGLYDMHGNVWEWCEDWYSAYSSGDVIDPKGPSSGSGRVLRGGGWLISADVCRSAGRDFYSPDRRHHNSGFRLVRIMP